MSNHSTLHPLSRVLPTRPFGPMRSPARALGWFSIGLGLAELTMPQKAGARRRRAERADADAHLRPARDRHRHRHPDLEGSVAVALGPRRRRRARRRHGRRRPRHPRSAAAHARLGRDAPRHRLRRHEGRREGGAGEEAREAVLARLHRPLRISTIGRRDARRCLEAEHADGTAARPCHGDGRKPGAAAHAGGRADRFVTALT